MQSSRVAKVLESLGLKLPPTPKPVAAYLPAVRNGNTIQTSGQLPIRRGKMVYTGIVGDTVTVEQAQEAARVATLNCLAAVRSVIGDLDEIVQVVRVKVFVASTPDFGEHPEVANGTSHLLEAVFGERGAHARSAIGCSSLPRNAPVEVELMVEIQEKGELDK